VLLAPNGEEVARIVPLTRLDLPPERARRLREDQAKHEQRAAREPAYARRWAQRFREASAAADAP
jgi:antitoxin (DNA-binding transcriptional repressor) of toxin-antitoxin stability system